MATEEQPPLRPRQKSFRRKYNKIRHQFKSIYETNTKLHEEEQRLIKVTRRLQEQNDQLLDLLLDTNESERVPKNLRYALSTPPPENEVPDLQNDEVESQEQAKEILDNARQQLESGDMTQRDYDTFVEELKNSLKKNASMVSLAHMETTVAHTSLELLKDNINQIPDEIMDEDTYLDAAHEDAYLALLDATLEGTQLNGDTQPSKPMLSEATLENPVSVYNWLRKHKPEVFVQEGGADKDKDKDKTDEKDSKASNSTPAAIKRESRTTKRASVVEMLDDDGNIVGNFTEPASSSKSKRKRDDDAYRPKGGGSSSSKRRKKSTGKGNEAE